MYKLVKIGIYHGNVCHMTHMYKFRLESNESFSEINNLSIVFKQIINQCRCRKQKNVLVLNLRFSVRVSKYTS